ncbi:aminotransferase class III-fold pyridoxal phosphate-dependent enzyme [Streptomyces sp. NPDC052079]|uniref:aminotransferase class III-fold pyridoxal phosphate-dependent enzyme n=1 Tax=Streptomyces sp. NPDC052079 TaxID=3155526 RepID=UPI003427B80D
MAEPTYEGPEAVTLPIVPVRARGMTIEGADGRRYLDCLSGAGTLALGHNHPVVLEAMRRIIDSGAPLDVSDAATPVRDAFVTELFLTLPPGLADRAQVRFCGPGAGDPMATALCAVRAATGRVDVLELTDALFWSGGECVVGGPPLEPDSGSPRAPRPTVADETLTGLGRTGAFWATEHSGITPDAMVLSASAGGGLPLAVVVHRDDVDVRDGPRAHAGNQLALAAGTATLAHVRENRLADHAAALGTRMLSRLRTLAEELTCVREVRGRGLLIGIELTDPEREYDDGPEPTPAEDDTRPSRPRPTVSGLPAAVRRECLRRGLIVGLGGPHARVVRLLPPLTITDEQATAVLDRLADALHAAAHRESPAVRGGPLRAG